MWTSPCIYWKTLCVELIKIFDRSQLLKYNQGFESHKSSTQRCHDLFFLRKTKPENFFYFNHIQKFPGWAKTRVFQEKDMGNWVFGFFHLFLGFSGFFMGFWVFLIPCILGISKYVKAGRTSFLNVEQYEK